MLPLTGVKVVEFANNIAGPYAGYILAMLGADVLKIERPEGGDDARAWGPPFWKDTSATFQCLNVNKKGITLDLKSADDIDWVKDYIESCDVLIHNLRPGVMDGLGLGSRGAASSATRASSTARCRPSAPRARCRRTAATSRWCRPSPGCSPSTAIRTGPACASAPRCWIWAARCGRRSAASRRCCSASAPARAASSTPRSTRRRSACSRCTSRASRPAASCPSGIPAAAWRWCCSRPSTASDGQVIVAAANDRLWAKFTAEIGHPEWAQDPRYKTNADRHANKEALVAAVTEIMRQRPREEWVRRLQKAGVPCAPINDITHMKAHPQTAALNMVQRVPEIDLDLMSLPLSFGGERPTIRTRAPKLGEHNAAVRGPAPGAPAAGVRADPPVRCGRMDILTAFC